MIQETLNILAVWGPWAQVLLMGVCLWGIYRLCRRERSLPRFSLLWRIIRSGWFGGLVLSSVALYVLKVPMAPMTRSLASLSATRGHRPPNMSFRSVADDGLHGLRDFEGKVILLNLWATWCPPCVQELPVFDRLQAAYRERGLVVIALSDEAPEHLRKFFAKRPVQLLTGHTSDLSWLPIEDFRPFTLIIDRDGILRDHLFGVQNYEGWEASLRPFL